MKKQIAVTVPYVLLITTSLAAAKDSLGTPCLGDNCHFPETNPREKSAEMTAKKQSGRRSKRAAIRRRNDLSNIWRDGVYYYYDATYINTKVIEQFERAVKAWQQDTCINFTRLFYPYAKKDRIRVLAYSHYCYSQLGKKGGEQNLVLGTGCESFGVTAHELGHALGLFHTMGRPDRDKHIQLHLYHIQQEVYRAEYNIRDERDSAHYGTGYDYGSIMHYPGSGYFSNYKPVSVPIDGRHVQTMGSEMLSFADLLVINKHYNCNEPHVQPRS